MEVKGTLLTKSFVDRVSYNLLGAAIEVHRALGPGLLESVYHKCLVHELTIRQIDFISDLRAPIEHKNLKTEAHLRCDILVEGCLVVELKAVESLTSVHDAQLLTYMKLLHVPKGVIINFHCKNLFYEGQKTMVNHLYSALAP